MSSKRAEIRVQAVAELLNKTAAGARVFSNRMAFLNCQSFPCAWVMVGEERSQLVAESPEEYERTSELIVRIRQPGAVTVEDDLDAVVGQVGAVLNEDIKLGIGGRVLPQQSGPVSYMSQGRRWYGEIDVEFSVTYFTEAAAIALDEFKVAHMDIDQDLTDGDIDVAQTLTIRN